MESIRRWVLLGGLFLIIAIILNIFLPLKEVLKNQIFYSFHLVLIIAYVVMTYYLVSVNEKFVCNQNTPVVTAVLNSQSQLLYKAYMERKMYLSPEEEKEIKKIENRRMTKLILHNPSKNNAMDVRVTLDAFVNGKPFKSSPPMDGSVDWQVQAGQTVTYVFNMEGDYLNPAEQKITKMTKEAKDSNKEEQLIFKLKLEYSDGCGIPIKYDKLSWYFDFRKNIWVYII